MNATASQLTYYGLLQLHQHLKVGYRNITHQSPDFNIKNPRGSVIFRDD